MTFLKRIKNNLLFRCKQIFIYKEHLRIKKQMSTASFIYDAICDKKTISEIRKYIRTPLSQEIHAILDKLETTGYIKSIKPLCHFPTVSVVIPHYNHAAELQEALVGLKNQTTIPDEIIVVDNHSFDIKKVRKVIQKHKKSLNLKLIELPANLFVGKSRQKGAETATSDIIIFHDADDISHKKRIEYTKHFFKKHPTALHLTIGLSRFKGNFFNYLSDLESLQLKHHVISTEQIFFAMKKKFVEQQFSSHKTKQIRIGCYEPTKNSFFGCQAAHPAYRKEIVKLIKWASPDTYTFTKFEDYDFNFILLLAGQKSYHIDLPLVYYRVDNSTYEQK